jgi:hypothetical protein
LALSFQKPSPPKEGESLLARLRVQENNKEEEK